MKKETSQNFKDQNEYNFTQNLSHDLVWIEDRPEFLSDSLRKNRELCN